MYMQMAHVEASPVFKHTHQEKILGVLEIYQQYMISEAAFVLYQDLPSLNVIIRSSPLNIHLSVPRLEVIAITIAVQK